ncbi:uncharacterized protein [Ptychodera flava]|uniref:uncharacterized protein isoform X3 n=1 Tax=Ptychodera flava TaxID=63121 RepID=UPI003969CCD7
MQQDSTTNTLSTPDQLDSKNSGRVIENELQPHAEAKSTTVDIDDGNPTPITSDEVDAIEQKAGTGPVEPVLNSAPIPSNASFEVREPANETDTAADNARQTEGYSDSDEVLIANVATQFENAEDLEKKAGEQSGGDDETSQKNGGDNDDSDENSHCEQSDDGGEISDLESEKPESDKAPGKAVSENGDDEKDPDIVVKYVPPSHIKRIVSETDDYMEQQFNARKITLAIKLPEDDALATIQRRLDEIGDMVTPRQERGSTMLDELDEPIRKYVLELTSQSTATFTKLRRKGWKVRHKFKYAIRMALFAVRFMDAAKRYIQTKKKPGRNDAAIKSDEIEDEGSLNATFNKNAPGKSSIHLDLQIYLTTRPEYRDAEYLKRIVWVLRTTKAFTMFSTEMEEEMARRVAYERYDNGRVIAYQGKPPDRFYYILSGRVNMLRQYKLQTGEVSKSMGFLNKGKITDTEEMEKQWNRESNLICKGPVEVLLVDKKDYFFLQNTDAGPPIDFLRTVDLFREFPCEEFLNHPEAIEFKYYGPNKQVVKDTNTRNWLYVVKSGVCKCVRRQEVVDVTQDKRLSSKQRLEKLGCAKGYSHADAMLETKLKRTIERGQKNFTLPEIPTSRRTSVVHQSKEATPSVVTMTDHESETVGSMLDGSEMGDETEHVDEVTGSTKKKFHRASVSIELPPLALAGSKERQSLVNNRQGRSMFMTQRARTETQIARKRRQFLDDEMEETPLRRAYLQLDLLKAGDMIGLNDISGLSRARRSGVSVWSDGAEIIKINKRFFRQHAGTVTMLKLETMNREYVSEADAMQNLEEQETWHQYKTILMKKLSKHGRIAKDQAKPPALSI